MTIAKTFTFTTTHFTPYAFVNTPATAFNLYVSSSTAAVAGGIYPNNTWAMPSPLPANYPNPPRATDDWGYTVHTDIRRVSGTCRRVCRSVRLI